MSDLTQLPATDPTNLLRYRDGIYAADFLACGIVKFDLFSWLANHPSTLAELCEARGLHPRPADVLLSLARAQGLLEVNEGVISVTTLAREHLVQGGPWSLAPYYASLADRPVVQEVEVVLRTGRPAHWEADDAEGDWHEAMTDPGFAEMFTAAMDCRGLFLGQKLAQVVELGEREQVLDLGGGSGIYSCCLLAADAHLKATVLEKSPVDAIARRCVDERDMSDRVEVVEGDFFSVDYPADHDVHLLSNVLHDWDLPEVERILEKSFETLPAGGLLLAHEAFLNEDKDGPLPVAEYSAILVTITQGRCYGVGEIRELMEKIGFGDVHWQKTAGDRSVISACKG